MNMVMGILIGWVAGFLFHLWRVRHLRRQLEHRLRQIMAVTGGSLAGNSQPLSWQEVFPPLVSQLRQQQFDREELLLQLQDWQRLADHFPMGFLRVDENNLVLSCNPIAQQLLKIEHWQPNVKVLLEWVRSYDLDQLIEQTRRRDADPVLQMRDWSFYPPGGEAKHTPLRGWALGLRQGHVVVFLENQLEMRTLIQQRDRWASDVAHELKTPLTSIRLVAETLQSRVDPQLRTWVDRLLEEVIRLGNLVQDLLELSRLNLGAVTTLQVSHLNLVPLIEAAWQSLEPQAEKKQQSLAYSGPEESWIWGDEQRLYRLLLNLLSNSLKYGAVATPIHLVLKQEDGKLWLEIFDHGPGFPADTEELIFEPFYRLDHARARDAGGTGLGLAIARQIVQAHGGSVQAGNHPQTGGAWLRLTLSDRIRPPNRIGAYG